MISVQDISYDVHHHQPIMPALLQAHENGKTSSAVITLWLSLLPPVVALYGYLSEPNAGVFLSALTPPPADYTTPAFGSNDHMTICQERCAQCEHPQTVADFSSI